MLPRQLLRHPYITAFVLSAPCFYTGLRTASCMRSASIALPAPQYGDGAAYWDGHYLADPKPYDWLEDYPNLRPLTEALPGEPSARILHVGCGNSLMPEQMHDDGFQHIVSIDISPVVIRQMSARNEARPSMRWLVMDATRMTFDDGAFDAVIDKSLLDTVDCEEEDATPIVSAYLREVARVLRPGGVFICVSFGRPADRLPYFKASGVDFDVSFLPISPRKDFAYLARLRPKSVSDAVMANGTLQSR